MQRGRNYKLQMHFSLWKNHTLLKKIFPQGQFLTHFFPHRCCRLSGVCYRLRAFHSICPTGAWVWEPGCSQCRWGTTGKKKTLSLKSLCMVEPLLWADGTVRRLHYSIKSNAGPSHFFNNVEHLCLSNTTALSTLTGRANSRQQTFLMINIHFLQHPITAQCTYWIDGLALFNWYFHLHLLQQMRQNLS